MTSIFLKTTSSNKSGSVILDNAPGFAFYSGLGMTAILTVKRLLNDYQHRTGADTSSLFHFNVYNLAIHRG